MRDLDYCYDRLTPFWVEILSYCTALGFQLILLFGWGLTRIKKLKTVIANALCYVFQCKCFKKKKDPTQKLLNKALLQ